MPRQNRTNQRGQEIRDYKATQLRKEKMILVLQKNLGIVTLACAIADIPRSTFYTWCKYDPEFKAKVEDVQLIADDFVESMHYQMIKEKSASNIIFHLKTKCKHRGYDERPTIINDGRLNIDVSKLTDQQLADLISGKEISGLPEKKT